jgi:hypothetical protein
VITIEVVPGTYAIARLDANAPVPGWVRAIEQHSTAFVSVTRTGDELSILAPVADVPLDVKSERPFRAIRVQGPLPFDAIGILAALTAPLASARIPLFTISTYDTDYVFVHEERFAAALDALHDSGVQVRR